MRKFHSSVWFRSCTLLIFGASVLSAGCRPEVSAVTTQPNVVLIVVDTLRADALMASRNGIPLMPKLNEFASGSWWFTNAVSQSSWTKPAVASLLTSMYFSVHNVQCGLATRITEGQTMRIDVLPNSADTISRVLKRAGFNTGCIQTNPQIDGQFGFAQDIDSYAYVGPDTKANKVTDMAIDALRWLAPPSFLYVHYMDPHGPYSPPPPYNSMFGPPPNLTEEDRRLMDDFTAFYHDKVLYDVKIHAQRKMGDLSEAGEAYARYMYDGEVRFIDDEVARLIQTARTQFPDCIIVVTSDHGEEFWEHGSIGHGKTLYQELIHVPLIVSIPGEKPLVWEQLVEMIDILPTVAACLNLPPDSRWQGTDLAKQVHETPNDERPAFSRTMTSMREANVDLRAVVRGKEKLIVDDGAGITRLYDLKADPSESENLAERQPEKVAELRGLLAEHERKNAEHPQSRIRGQANLDDPEVLEHLKSIGYLK